MKTLAKTKKTSYAVDLLPAIPMTITHNLNCSKPLVNVYCGGDQVTAMVSIGEDPADPKNKTIIISAGPLPGCEVRFFGV